MTRRTLLPTRRHSVGAARGLAFHARLIGAAMLATLLAGCGFHLRGAAVLPFDTLYVQADPASQFANQLRRSLRAGSQTRVMDNAKEAQVTLQIVNEARDKQILSLAVSGRVAEYQLIYRVAYRLTDAKNTEYIPTTRLELRRDITFNDSAVLSKESEESLLYRDMQNDAVQQIVRRLQVAKLEPKP